MERMIFPPIDVLAFVHRYGLRLLRLSECVIRSRSNIFAALLWTLLPEQRTSRIVLNISQRHVEARLCDGVAAVEQPGNDLIYVAESLVAIGLQSALLLVPTVDH